MQLLQSFQRRRRRFEASWAAFLVGGFTWLACQEKSASPLKQPAPLQRLTRDVPVRGGLRPTELEAAGGPAEALMGMTPPARAQRLLLEKGALRVEGGGAAAAPLDSPSLPSVVRALSRERPALLVPDEETYLAQAAPLLAALNGVGVSAWLSAPGGGVAFPVVLRDESAFGAWLDEPKPGKVRIVQRADGLELQTNIGKLPGPDGGGPTVPLRRGQLDLPLLRRGLEQLHARFHSDDVCLLPSFGTELAKSVAVLSGDYRAMGQPIFPRLCLVYPRPGSGARGDTH